MKQMETPLKSLADVWLLFSLSQDRRRATVAPASQTVHADLPAPAPAAKASKTI